jgi:ubiquinone/menaquinone biosynthesis C-methylase UbiE
MSKTVVCHWWLGYLLLLPLRKIYHKPERIIGPYVKPGMTVMDYGSAMGFFSIPFAQIVGSAGKVYCVDIQDKMLDKLKQRAIDFNVEQIIHTLKVGGDYNASKLAGTLDFALLFAVAHEVPDRAKLFSELSLMLKPGGKLMFAEPKGHVSEEDFARSISYAEQSGFEVVQPKVLGKKGLSALLQKN